MRSRPFLFRLVVAGCGMLLLCVAMVIGLGWVVRDPDHWGDKMLGPERCTRFQGAYARVLGTLLPGDRDGDGFPDSVEWYLQTDPGDPGKHPECLMVREADEAEQGFAASALWDEFAMPNWQFVAEPGERQRIHARLEFCRRYAASIPGFMDAAWSTAVFARGMHIVINPAGIYHTSPLPQVAHPGRIPVCLPGGTPTLEPLLVPVATDGSCEFEIAVPKDVVPDDIGHTNDFHGEVLTFEHPNASGKSNWIVYGIARRQTPIPVTVEERPPDSRARAARPIGPRVNGPVASLRWERAAEATGPYLIEATRDATGREWFSVTVCPSEARTALISYRLQNSKRGFDGRLRFRVVPTKLVGP